MSQLLELYWSPVYAYLRRSGLSREDAADLTQEFLTERVLDGPLLEQANQERGRFRSFLLSAVKNLLIDRARRDRARLRHTVRWTEEMLDAAEPRDEDDPATAFDRQYAATVVSRAVQLLETECDERGMNRQWIVFDERVVRKARGVKPAAIDDLAARVNAQTPQVV